MDKYDVQEGGSYNPPMSDRPWAHCLQRSLALRIANVPTSNRHPLWNERHIHPLPDPTTVPLEVEARLLPSHLQAVTSLRLDSIQRRRIVTLARHGSFHSKLSFTHVNSPPSSHQERLGYVLQLMRGVHGVTHQERSAIICCIHPGARPGALLISYHQRIGLSNRKIPSFTAPYKRRRRPGVSSRLD